MLERKCSPEVPVTSGVPKGSVLGPLLFLLYINDLPENIQSQIKLSADDTAVYLTVWGPSDSNILQSNLNYLQEWEQTWDMKFNPSKCQVLHISRARQPIHSQYTLHGEILESVDWARYLGVSISKDLSWNTYISKFTSKANQTLGFVKRNVRTKNQSFKELAYKTLVRPSKTYKRQKWCKGGPHPGSQIVIPTMIAFLRCRVTSVGAPSNIAATLCILQCFTKYNMALLQCLCHRISSVLLESLATCIPLVSARYMFLLTITGFRFFLWLLFYGTGSPQIW